MSGENKKFSIQAAAKMARLSTHTIRAWEKRYKAVTHERADNGHRFYSEKEVQRLIFLSELTQFGTNISQIAHLNDPDLEALHQKLIKQGASEILKANLTSDIDLTATRKSLLDAVGSYKVDTISELLSAMRLSLAPRVFAMDILIPLLNEAKIKKDNGHLPAAQVQALLSIVKFHSGTIIYSHIEKNINSSKKFIITSLEEEPHNLSLLVSALLCCEHKKFFYYLNSNLPSESIVEAVQATEASVLILTLPEHDPGKKIQSQLEKIVSELNSKVRIWVVSVGSESKIKNQQSSVISINSLESLDEMLSTDA